MAPRFRISSHTIHIETGCEHQPAKHTQFYGYYYEDYIIFAAAVVEIIPANPSNVIEYKSVLTGNHMKQQKGRQMMNNLGQRVKETANYLRERGVTEPEVLVILGSGLNDYADRVSDALVIPYSEIPNFHTGKAEGHRGQLIYGTHMGKKVILLAGRFHYYESHDMNITAFPSRVMVELGVKRFVITNAAGCVNTNFHAGQLMLISDHINYSGNNPLIGENLDEYGLRFPDMTYTYSKELREKVKLEASRVGVELAEGVYMMFSGPSFETPAEIRMARVLGADAVGMSSVPEAIIASHAKIEVIGISFLSNMAAGVLDQPLTGAEVTEAGIKIQPVFSQIADIAIAI